MKNLLSANTLTYFARESVTEKKIFMTLAPGHVQDQGAGKRTGCTQVTEPQGNQGILKGEVSLYH